MRVRATFHHFKIAGQIGMGGMSRVFRARDTSLGRDVALKILNRSCSQDPARLTQFEREAEITASMSHPNVVRVFSAGHDQGYYYIAMELVAGGSLDDLIRKKRRVPEGQVLAMAEQIVKGLKAAHEAGLIHRDLKPGNILLTEDGTPKIVDFGLAMLAREADGQGEIWATPYYVPPETLRHEPEDFRSDIFSLGATLHHALLGRPPCDKDTSSLEELKLLKSKPVHVKPADARLSEETCALLERAQAIRPADRYDSYDSLLDHLQHAQRRLRRGGKGRPWPGRRRRFGAREAALTAAGLAALFGLVYILTPADEPPPAPVASGEALPTDADPTAGSDTTTTTRFLAARDAMVNSDFGKARQLFQELAADDAVRQPTRNWARWNAGLNALLMGDNGGAVRLYGALARDGLYSEHPGEVELARFFHESAGWLAAEGPVPDARRSDCPPDSVRAIGLLAGALKNWHLGDAAGARSWFEAFAAAKPPKTAAWVASCQGLAATERREAGLIAALPGMDTVALPPDEAADVVRKARETVASLTLDGPAKRKAAAGVETVAQALGMKPEGGAGGTAPEIGRSEAEELEKLAAADRDAAGMGSAYRFNDAAAALEKLALTTGAAQRAAAAHVKAWRNAAAFLDQLAKDLGTAPVDGVLDTPTGPVRARMAITAGQLTARPASGPELKLPLGRVPAALLVELADNVLTGVRDADDHFRRRELLYCFALRAGLPTTAAEYGAELVAELGTFRETMSLLGARAPEQLPAPKPVESGDSIFENP